MGISRDTAVSADGRNVYLPGFPLGGRGDMQGGIVAFGRDGRSGALRQLGGAAGCYVPKGPDGCTSVPDRADATGLALSPDDRHLYLLGESGFAVYSRNAATGELGYSGCITSFSDLHDCRHTRIDLSAFAGLAFAPDGRTAYAGGSDTDEGVITLAREPATGFLSIAGCATSGASSPCLELPYLNPVALDVAPDGSVLTASRERFAVLRPGVAVAAGPLTLDRSGTARVALRCDSTAGRCEGRLRIVGAAASLIRVRFAEGGYSVEPGTTASVALRFTRAGRSDVQLQRNVEYDVFARTRTGGATVTSVRTIRFGAPPRGFAARWLPERPGRCLPPLARTVVRTARARVYQRRARDGIVHTYGCLASSGRAVPLDNVDDLDNGHQLLPPVALAGPFVAYQDIYSYENAAEPGEYYVTAHVVDLRTGRTVRQGCSDPDCYANLDSLVLAPTGAVAWVSDNRVWRLAGARKTPERLDGGGEVPADSLRLRGSRLSWVEGGRPRRATLR
jgi:hypothetical protein